MGGKRDLIFVLLPDHRTRGIPTWMFDPVRCDALRFDRDAAIDPQALLDLARLLDLHQSEEAHQGDEPR